MAEIGHRAVVLTIAGLDPTGGAGLLADVRMAELLGCKALALATCTTEQSTQGLFASHAVPVEFLARQLLRLLEDVSVDAIKIGMLATVEHAAMLGEILAQRSLPVVWDPCVLPSRGPGVLMMGLPGDALRALLPVTTVCTPNLAEAEALTGYEVQSLAAMHAAALRLCEQGARAALVKGGHLREGDRVCDVLAQGREVQVLSSTRVELEGEVHGTGCALSSAIAARLARGEALAEACAKAAGDVRARLAAPVAIGQGAKAVF